VSLLGFMQNGTFLSKNKISDLGFIYKAHHYFFKGMLGTKGT